MGKNRFYNLLWESNCPFIYARVHVTPHDAMKKNKTRIHFVIFSGMSNFFKAIKLLKLVFVPFSSCWRNCSPLEQYFRHTENHVARS